MLVQFVYTEHVFISHDQDNYHLNIRLVSYICVFYLETFRISSDKNF